MPTGKTIDPAAIQALDKMGAYLRSLGSFAIEAEMATDDVLASGQKVKQTGLVQLKVRRPDRLRVDIAGDRRTQQLFYDGKTFTIYDRPANYYGSFAAPPRLAELVKTVEETYGIDMPLADLFHWGSDAKATAAITAASDLGASMIKGVTCDHYAFRQPEVDWQIWIERGTKPLPRKLVITTMTEKMQPEHEMVMTWNLEPQVTEQTFAFVPPQRRAEDRVRQGRRRARRRGARRCPTPGPFQPHRRKDPRHDLRNRPQARAPPHPGAGQSRWSSSPCWPPTRRTPSSSRAAPSPIARTR